MHCFKQWPASSYAKVNFVWEVSNDSTIDDRNQSHSHSQRYSMYWNQTRKKQKCSVWKVYVQCFLATNSCCVRVNLQHFFSFVLVHISLSALSVIISPFCLFFCFLFDHTSTHTLFFKHTHWCHCLRWMFNTSNGNKKCHVERQREVF